jgi:hypothetical protein
MNINIGMTVELRPVTISLVESITLDLYPTHPAVLTDFGISSQKHYEAIYYPVREGEITPQQLEGALGCGPRLTELVNAAPSNPHKGIEFRTAWDDLLPRSRQPEPAGRRLEFDMDR